MILSPIYILIFPYGKAGCRQAPEWTRSWPSCNCNHYLLMSATSFWKLFCFLFQFSIHVSSANKRTASLLHILLSGTTELKKETWLTKSSLIVNNWYIGKVYWLLFWPIISCALIYLKIHRGIQNGLEIVSVWMFFSKTWFTANIPQRCHRSLSIMAIITRH